MLIEEIKIPVPWGHVAALWWGPRDKQPVIAIHGWQDNAGTWDNLIPLLPSTMAFLCIDLPGHGKSSHYDPGMVYYLFWDGVYLLRRIIKLFEWTNVVLMGHSLGGAVSFMYAASFPNEVDRIVCVDVASPAVMTPKEAVQITGSLIDAMLNFEQVSLKDYVFDSYEDTIDAMYYGHNGSVSEENCEVMLNRGASVTSEGYYFNRDLRLKVSFLAMMSIDQALEYAGQITCKVLNIKAKPENNLGRDEYYRIIIEKLRETAKVTFVEVEGTHHLHMNTPALIAPILKQFFEDLI